MREFTCYQWLIQDNQDTCYPRFFVAKKHYKSKADVWAAYGPENTEYCFRPLKPIKESKLTGELAQHVYSFQREGH